MNIGAKLADEIENNSTKNSQANSQRPSVTISPLNCPKL